MSAPATPSVRDLADGIAGDAQRLVELQVELAKQEGRELLRRNLVAMGFLYGGGTIAVVAVLLVIPLVLTALFPERRLAVTVIVLASYLLVALVVMLIGRALLKLEPPKKTIDSLKETAQWALRQISSNKR